MDQAPGHLTGNVCAAVDLFSPVKLACGCSDLLVHMIVSSMISARLDLLAVLGHLWVM